MGTQPIASFCAICLMVICSVALWTDCRCRRIPNRLILVGLLCTCLSMLTEVILNGAWKNAAGRLAAGGLAALLHGIPYTCGQMGAGDLKLAAVIGLLMGWQTWNIYLGCYGLVLVIAAAVLLLIPTKYRKSSLPLALFMAIAYYLCLFNASWL